MTRVSDKKDRYARVSVNVVKTTEKAVILNKDGDQQPVPRSLLSFHAEKLISDPRSKGTTQIIEIKEWKLLELGWV